MLLALFLLLMIAMVAGPSLVGEKGYVLVSMGQYTIETSVVVLGFMLLASVVVFLGLEWLIKRLIRMLAGSKLWLGSFSQRRLNKAYFKGITAFFEGDLKRADRWLRKAEAGDFDGVNWLAAGQVAAELGENSRAQKLWQRAADESDSDYAAHVCIAKFHLNEHSPQLALTIIENLDDKEKLRKSSVVLWISCLAELGRWQEIQNRLPGWKKILDDEYAEWATKAAHGEFAEIASKSGANALVQHWHQLPRADRKDQAKRAAFVQQLLDQGMHHDAQKHLVEWQTTGPVDRLLPLFKQLRVADPSPSTKLLEHWLKKDEDNVEFLTTLGIIAMNSGNDILAEKALQKAAKLKATPENLRLLAQISERKQDNVKALALFKQSVEK
jgi:HemY protein